MPVYKAKILNKEVSINYNLSEKDKLEEAISTINSKLSKYDNQDGKVSDSTLLSFLAINLQAEISEITKNQKNHDLENKNQIINNENISLKDKLYTLSEENKLIIEENTSVKKNLNEIQDQLEIIIRLIKKIYED